MDSSPPSPSVPGILQARILEWGSHFLLQGIFPTQGSNLGLLHCKLLLYRLSQQGNLKQYLVLGMIMGCIPLIIASIYS